MRKHRSFKGVKPIVVPDQCVNIRAVLDRISQGNPINVQLRQHTPLPPDGLDMNDFDTGTEEILDLVDAQEVSERVEKAQLEQAKAAKKKRDEQNAAAFEQRVAEEVAARLAAQQQQE